MIISAGRKYIFVHAPKTGGTSLALALEARAMKEDIMLGDTPKALKRRRRLKGITTQGRLWKHSTLADIEGLISPVQMAEFFTFTLVRNPWDRMVSYYHWLQEQSFSHPAVRLAQDLPFEGFATSPQILQALKAAPACHYMRDARGVEHCKAYIRLEHFHEDAAGLIAHLGFDLALTHVNRSKRNRAYQSYYTQTSREAVHWACQVDIEKFGYCFETA